MVDFDNPLSQEFLDEYAKSLREAWGDDLTRPRQFVIGRLNTNGNIDTVVKKGEYGRVWVKQPGEDTGDAVQAINTILQPHEITPKRPVMVKLVGNKFLITGKAPESADYDAQMAVAPQRPTNREQYNVALITPSSPDSSFFALYRGGMFQLNNTVYRITGIPSSDLSGTVPVANALSIKVELDPITATWHETTGSAFTTSSMTAAFKNGDLDTTRTDGRYLIGWIRLYDGQSAIELDDILPGEYMLNIIDDHGEMVGLGDDDHSQYIFNAPASDNRNVIQPTGDFNPLGFNDRNGVLRLYIEESGDIITDPNEPSNTILGDGVGRVVTGFDNVFIGKNAGKDGDSDSNTFIGSSAGNAIGSGFNNIGIGVAALLLLEDGLSNTAIGTTALQDVVSGDENVGIGENALPNTTGNQNVGIGVDSGFNNAAGDGNVYIGHNAGPTAHVGDNELYIHNAETDSPLIKGNFNTKELTVNGQLETAQGRRKNTTRVTTTYTALVTDEEIYANSNGGAFTITLPTGVAGQHFRIHNTGTSGNDITIDGGGAETVKGAATQALIDAETLELTFETTENWW